MKDFRFKHQALIQDYHELQKETEYKMRKLEMMKQKRLNLDAQVRFMRRRYKHLKQDQTSPNMLRLLESRGDLSSKRKKNSGLRASVPCFDLKHKGPVCNNKDALGANNATNSTSLPDLNDFSNKVSGFDLNQISREEDEPEVNGEETKLGNGIDCEMKFPVCRDLEKELNREVKRKVSWQDPVALRV